MSGNMPPLSPEGAAWLNSLDLIHVYCGRRESEHPHGRSFGPGPCGFPKKEWSEFEFRTAAVTGAARGLCDANCHLHGQGDSFHVATCAAEIARDQLAAALRPHETHSAILDALLPVVDRIANERAAAEKQHLTTVLADLLRLTYDVELDSGTRAARKESERVADVFRARIAEHCRERDHRIRADRAALRASNGEGT